MTARTISIIMVTMILAVLVLLAGCGSKNGTTDQPDPNPCYLVQMGYGHICRAVDPEAGVVCWQYGQGISCLPLRDTKLAKDTER